MNAFPFVYPYQLLIDLNAKSKADNITLPGFLKEALKQSDPTDFQKLEEFLLNEIENASLQDVNSANYFLLISRHALLYFFYRGDENLEQALEVINRRMGALRQVEVIDFPGESWEQYMSLLSAAHKRRFRFISLEAYEKSIGDLKWSQFDQQFIADLSTVLGFTYCLEETRDQSGKGKIWLHKAINEQQGSLGLLARLLMIYYLRQEKNVDNKSRIQSLLGELKEINKSTEDAIDRGIYDAAVFDVEASLIENTIANFNDELTRLEDAQLKLKGLETQFAKKSDLPTFTQSYVEGTIANLYVALYGMTDDTLEQASFGKSALHHAEQSASLAEACRDHVGEMNGRTQRARILVETSQHATEKDIKELVQYFKKRQDYPSYLAGMHTYVDLLDQNGHSDKIHDLLLDIFKLGNKRIDQGGFYLINGALELANRIMLAETHKPGVSWMVEVLNGFFDRVTEVIDTLEDNLELFGKSLVERFRLNFIEFEPISHFNIKVYLRYQLYEMKMARIGAIITGDGTTQKLLENLISEMEYDNNPMSFIKADWDEFKLVPNSVRNSTLNKCINISKGDLPLAAEHLDFSYRNLRSYITFKEVNRLGFFLDMQQTTNKQLEQGIRYMFYDLYKNGTIFEVVFDMPRFLVKFAQSGFFSQDLERELNIKGTTAKKYIKIMVEIGLIRQDKTTGRKHYYRLIRENVMTRLGKDQATLIG